MTALSVFVEDAGPYKHLKSLTGMKRSRGYLTTESSAAYNESIEIDLRRPAVAAHCTEQAG